MIAVGLLLVVGVVVVVSPAVAEDGSIEVESDDPPSEIDPDDGMEFSAVFENTDNESNAFFVAHYVEDEAVTGPEIRSLDGEHTRIERFSATNDELEEAIGEELQPGDSYDHQIVVFEDDDGEPGEETDSDGASFDVSERDAVDPAEALDITSYDPAERYVEPLRSRPGAEVRNTADEGLYFEVVVTIDGDEVESSIRPIDADETGTGWVDVEFEEAQAETSMDLAPGETYPASIEVYSFDPDGDPQRGEFLGQRSHRIEVLSFDEAFTVDVTREPPDSAQSADRLPFEVTVDTDIPYPQTATIDVDLFVDDVRIAELESRVRSDRGDEFSGEFSITDREDIDSTTYGAGDDVPYRIRTVARTDERRTEIGSFSGSVELIGDIDATFTTVEISDPIVRGTDGELEAEIVNTGEDAVEAELEYGTRNQLIGSTSVTIPRGDERTVSDTVSVSAIEDVMGTIDDDESADIRVRLRETVTDPERGAVLDRSADRVQVFGSPAALYEETLTTETEFTTSASHGDSQETRLVIETEHSDDVPIEIEYGIDGDPVVLSERVVGGEDRVHRETLDASVEEMIRDGTVDPDETHEQYLELRVRAGGESIVVANDVAPLAVDDDVGVVGETAEGISLPNSPTDLGATDELDAEDRQEAQQQRGFLTNDPDSSVAVLDDPFALTLTGFMLSILSIVYPMVREQN